MTSKNVKIPMELVEKIEKRLPDKTVGEGLLEIYKEYELLEGLALSIKMNRKDLDGSTVYEVMVDRDNRINELQTQIDELKTMLQGMEIFFKKVKK